MSRPLHFDSPNAKPAETMEELLHSAEADWKHKRKDAAFIKLLGAVAMISQGTAQAIRLSEAALAIANGQDPGEPPPLP